MGKKCASSHEIDFRITKCIDFSKNKSYRRNLVKPNNVNGDQRKYIAT
jgi:hypothetical protein